MCCFERYLRSIAAILLLALLSAPAWPVDGTFQGQVVAPPANERPVRGWIYVQGRNHMLRRVEVGHAQIVLAGDLPAIRQHRCTLDCLSAGQEIRVTAEQDPNGEWRAKRVEILRLTASRV